MWHVTYFIQTSSSAMIKFPSLRSNIIEQELAREWKVRHPLCLYLHYSSQLQNANNKKRSQPETNSKGNAR